MAFTSAIDQLRRLLPPADAETYNDALECLEMEWDDRGIVIVVTPDEVMFTQQECHKYPLAAWDALWRDYSVELMAERIAFYFQ